MIEPELGTSRGAQMNSADSGLAERAPIYLSFDVSAGVGSNEELTQRAWLFLPEHPADAQAVLLCLAGGCYDKHYWHLEVEGHPGYSFGEHMAALGFIVIAVDHLGVGESTDPISSGPLGLKLLAAGDAEVARQVRERLQRGSLHEDLPLSTAALIGVGHSMGACLTTMVQATAHPYDAVALLGYGVQITNVYDDQADAAGLEQRIQQTLELSCQLTTAKPTDSHLIGPRSYLAELFYAGEVPPDVMQADTAAQSRVPLRATAEVTTPGMVEQYAPQVDVPVFLAFGAALDVSPNPLATRGPLTSRSTSCLGRVIATISAVIAVSCGIASHAGCRPSFPPWRLR
jgi:pimeloyl-ACP methyl ester carboxylesterase